MVVKKKTCGISDRNSKTNDTTHTNPQTTKLEIKTKKGILSVTTTIEDSKLNDVVFEKEITKADITPIEATKVAVKAVADAVVSAVAKVVPEDKTKQKVSFFK